MNFKLKLGLILACLLFLSACQKEEILEQPPIVEDSVMLEEIIGTDPVLDKFFNGIADHDIVVNLNNEAKVNKIKLAMAKDNQQTAFVQDYVRQVGFPLWGQAKLHYLGSDRHLYALPFAKSTSNSTTAILHIVVDKDKFLYELALRADVTNYLVEYDNGTNDFYWENLLSFVVDFIVYDDAIFDFIDDQIYDWLNQNEETYLTETGDTRSDDCISWSYQWCVPNGPFTLQEQGDERSCPPNYHYITVHGRTCDETTVGGPHNPGGQTGGVPSLGGGGSSSNGNAGSNNVGNNEPPTNPGTDPGTWGDEGSNLPTNLQAAVLHNFLNELEEQGQLSWFNQNKHVDLRRAIFDRITSTPLNINILQIAHRLVDLMEKNDLVFDADTIEFLLNNLEEAIEVNVIGESEEDDVTDFLEPCPSSFNFTSSGDGGSTNLNCIKYGSIYLELVGGPYPESIEYKCYELPDLCIATGVYENYK